MPKNATGEVRCSVRGEWSVVVRTWTKRKTFQLPTCGSEQEARARAELLAANAYRFRCAGSNRAQAEEALACIAAATAASLDSATQVARELLMGNIPPQMSVPETETQSPITSDVSASEIPRGDRGPRFSAAHITDAKRVARGEQYLAARAILRSRSVEREQPRILILAGGKPSEELGTIRELWRGPWRAHVTAADLCETNLSAAIDAGADEVWCGDLGAFEHRLPATAYGRDTKPRACIPAALLAGGRFDLMHLDFCGTVTASMAGLVGRYHREALTNGGVNIVAFSYGHDVPEAFLSVARGGALTGRRGAAVKALMDRGVPEAVCGRIAFLARGGMRVETIVLYKGNAVPMCSVLFSKRQTAKREGDAVKPQGKTWWLRPGLEYSEWPQNENGDCSHVAVTKISDTDLEDAIEHVDAAALYALPEERLRAIRRRAAARKAVNTREAARTNGASA